MALEGTGAEAGKGQEASLPQLKLKEVARSKEPLKLVEESSPSRNQIKTCPYKDYTMVIIKGSPNMLAFENSGQEIVSFGKNIGILIPRIRGELISIMEKMELKDVSLMIGEQFLAIAVPKKIPRHDPYLSKAFLTQANDVNLPPTRWEDFTPESYGGEEGSLERWLGKFLQEQYGAVKEIGIKPHSYYASTSPKSFFIVNANGKTMFEDKVEEVGDNFIVDPTNCDVVYYLEGGNNPVNLIKLDTGKDPKLWQTEKANLPKRYGRLYGLDLDPSGKFFLLETENRIVFLRKDTLEEIGNLEDVFGAHFDPQGRIRAVAKTGHFVIYELNFAEFVLVIEGKRIADLAKGINPEDLFRKEGEGKSAAVKASTAERLAPLKKQFIPIFAQKIQEAVSLENLGDVAKALDRLKLQFNTQGLKGEEIDFVVSDIITLIEGKQHELAIPLAKQMLTGATESLGRLSVANFHTLRDEIGRLKALEGFLDEPTRAQIREFERRFGEQTAELFRTQGNVVTKEVDSLVTGVKTKLENITNRADFSDWQEFSLPQLTARLGFLAANVPLEAVEVQESILAARKRLQGIAAEFDTKFKENYAEVREKAASLTEAKVALIKTDIKGIIERLRARRFAQRNSAEQYLLGSDARKALEAEIGSLEQESPDVWSELTRELKVSLANALYEIERGTLTEVAGTGQQMVRFGDTLFPKWEAHVKEKRQRQVDLIFIPNEKSAGPEISADKIYGDVGLAVINSRGKLEKVRLFEEWKDENEWRLGAMSFRGKNIPPSYVTQADYKKIKQTYADWNRGEKSSLRQEFQKKRQVLLDLAKERQKIGQRNEEDKVWQTRYRKSLSDYSEFVAQNHILLLQRVDEIRNKSEGEYENGKGFTPSWQNHWVVDKDTQRYLSEMAEALKMQLDLQEGILNLKGHAGVGKDVLVKMFCTSINGTNRPYFAIDGTKWTTEFELSEDVVLEAKEGASQTMKIPSVVLNAIQTPGAVMYFNEFNAMPEQAQIFLHALMDEKRTLTLKTSSGKNVKALPSVLFISSMNPDYPGTFAPQFATRSRMVDLEINYPPLERQKDPNDPNPNPPYNASEPLRIAREVASLSPLTYEPNMDRNEFVKMWDKYVNGIENEANNPTSAQKFDMDVILAIVQFADRLRKDFTLQFDKSSLARKALPVTQPFTGRESRRSAYFLNRMKPEDKTTANPEEVARNLIDRFFLTHIDNREDRDKIQKTMATWTSSKRLAR